MREIRWNQKKKKKIWERLNTLIRDKPRDLLCPGSQMKKLLKGGDAAQLYKMPLNDQEKWRIKSNGHLETWGSLMTLPKNIFKWNGSDPKDQHEFNDHELDENRHELSKENYSKSKSFLEFVFSSINIVRALFQI